VARLTFHNKGEKVRAIPANRADRPGAISVVVADDHPVALHGIVEVLKSNCDMTIVAACSDGAAASQAICQLAPTVAVLDIHMPSLSGLDVLARISAEHSSTNVVLLTASTCEGQLLTAIARGAKGIVLKEAALNELVQCVRAVAAGRHWMPSNLIGAALERKAGCQSAGRRLAQLLTSRERQIILMVAEGLSNKEIGHRLDLTEATVKIHLHSVYKKLGVKNRTALTTVTITHRDELILSNGTPGARRESGRHADRIYHPSP
jgi:DNA-binding NarL/FixJ family response regulator